MMESGSDSAPTDDEGFVGDVFFASYRRLVGQLYALCGDLGAAEDVVQEAFVRALDHAGAFRRTNNPEAWLCRVAINLQRNKWRRLKARLGAEHRLVESESTPTPELGPDHVAVMAALMTLPEVQRTAITLHHLLDLSVVEVADIVQAPIGTVKARLSRGRASMAAALSDRDEERHV